MEKKHDNYHVRPFPQQPKRGGKQLIEALDQLEETLGANTPNLERLRLIQSKMHEVTQKYNDDLLINMIRNLSLDLDTYQQKPNRVVLQKILRQLLKIRIELKHHP